MLVDHRPAVPDIRRNAEELGHEVLSARELAARELPAQPEASAVLAVWELRLKRGQGSPMNTLP